MTIRDRTAIIILIVILLLIIGLGILSGLKIGADSGQILNLPPDIRLLK